jgi:biofilm PGA synthesis N-glycosyltransferase PgaC
MTQHGDYVIISPVRDEEAFLGVTIESVLGQTLRPLEWVIVDDGSRDGTAAIAEEAARSHPWIRVVRREPRSDRQVGGGVVRAFRHGLAAVEAVDYRFLCKMDGDLRFGPRYFECIRRRFDEDPRLGTLSGKSYHLRGGRLVKEYTRDDFSHGTVKFYRRECYEAIGGFVTEVMWDGIDCHRCRMLGWKAASLDRPELRITHLRQMGSSDRGVLVGRRRHGRGQYFMGTHPLYIVASALRRLTDPPWVLGSVMILVGYFQAAWRRVPRYEDPEFRRHLRRWQMARLFPWVKESGGVGPGKSCRS